MQRSEASENVVVTIPTPTYRFPWPDTERINNELLRIVLQREKEGRSMALGNVDGCPKLPSALSGRTRTT